MPVRSFLIHIAKDSTFCGCSSPREASQLPVTQWLIQLQAKNRKDWISCSLLMEILARVRWGAFSCPEAALILVSTKNLPRPLGDIWDGPTPEVRDSRTSRHSAHAQSQGRQSDWLRIRNDYSAHARKIGHSWRSRLKEGHPLGTRTE